MVQQFPSRKWHLMQDTEQKITINMFARLCSFRPLGDLALRAPLSELDSGVPTSLPNACHPVQSIESVRFVQNLSKFLSQETKRLTVSLQLLDVPELLAANCSCIALITLLIRCGTTHQYTASPYNKLWQAQCDLYVVPNRLMLNI